MNNWRLDFIDFLGDDFEKLNELLVFLDDHRFYIVARNKCPDALTFQQRLVSISQVTLMNEYHEQAVYLGLQSFLGSKLFDKLEDLDFGLRLLLFMERLQDLQ